MDTKFYRFTGDKQKIRITSANKIGLSMYEIEKKKDYRRQRDYLECTILLHSVESE